MTDDDHKPRRAPYRSSEIAQRWGVSPQAVVAAIKSGRLDGFQLQRIWLITPESVERVERGGSQ
jgi:predicted transcriptional regulator